MNMTEESLEVFQPPATFQEGKNILWARHTQSSDVLIWNSFIAPISTPVDFSWLQLSDLILSFSPPLRTYFFLSYFFSEIHTVSPPFPFDFLFSLETTSPVVISLNTGGRRGGLSMGNSRNKARFLLLRLKKRNPDLWKLIKLLFAFF